MGGTALSPRDPHWTSGGDEVVRGAPVQIDHIEDFVEISSTQPIKWPTKGGGESDPRPDATTEGGRCSTLSQEMDTLHGRTGNQCTYRVPRALVPDAAKTRWCSQVLSERFKWNVTVWHKFNATCEGIDGPPGQNLFQNNSGFNRRDNRQRQPLWRLMGYILHSSPWFILSLS